MKPTLFISFTPLLVVRFFFYNFFVLHGSIKEPCRYQVWMSTLRASYYLDMFFPPQFLIGLGDFWSLRTKRDIREFSALRGFIYGG